MAAEDRGGISNTGMAIVSALSTTVVLVRLFARGYMIKELGWDDLFITLAMLLSWVVVALSMMVNHHGSGRHFAAVLSNPASLVSMFKWLVGAQLVYMLTLWLCRTSGLAFYARLNPMPRFQMYLRIAFAFVTAVYIAQTLIIALQCIPLAALWNGAEGKCLGSRVVFILTSVLTIVCDSLILLLPINIILSLKATLTRKIVLGFVMCFGLLYVGQSPVYMNANNRSAVVTSIIRTVSMIVALNHPEDPTWYYSVVMVWSCTEIATAIIALSLPALKGLFGSVLKKRPTPESGNSGDSFPLSSSSRRRRIFEPSFPNNAQVLTGHGSEEVLWVKDERQIQVVDTVQVDVEDLTSRYRPS